MTRATRAARETQFGGHPSCTMTIIRSIRIYLSIFVHEFENDVKLLNAIRLKSIVRLRLSVGYVLTSGTQRRRCLMTEYFVPCEYPKKNGKTKKKKLK